MNILSKLISFVDPKVLFSDAVGELGSLVTDAADVDDLRPLPRLRPTIKRKLVFRNKNENSTISNEPSELDFRLACSTFPGDTGSEVAELSVIILREFQLSTLRIKAHQTDHKFYLNAA